jgi:hypothetical protein
MKKVIVVLFLLWIWLMPLDAQNKLEIFGYLESQMMGLRLQGKFFQWYTNKLRVDLKSELSSHITFAANFDYITHHGKTRWNILDFLSPEIKEGVPAGMAAYYGMQFSDDTFLDNAYVKLSFRHADLILGKQQISLGTGYVWNPTDIFNVKDVLDPTYEQPGHNAVRLDVPLAALSSLTFIYAPESSWRESGKLIRWKGTLLGFDIDVSAIETWWRFHDYTRLDPETGFFREAPEKRRLLGVSTAGEVLGLGVWGEFASNWLERSEKFYELVCGINYTFDFQTFIMLEYYRNTLGKSDSRGYSLNDWMRFYASEQKAISRDQVYVLIQHPATDLLELGLQSVASFSDHSVALVPTLQYSLSDNADVFAYLNLNLGKEGTVFARTTGSGGLLRVRVYF